MTTVDALLGTPGARPLVELDAVTGGCALILAPHPDDESLGCGGLIAASCARGQPPLVVVLTDGAASHPGSHEYPPYRLRALREAETLAAVACLGLSASRVVFLRLPDAAAPTSGPGFESAVDHLADLARSHACRAVLASWIHDPHCDHEAAALIARAAAQAVGIPHRSYVVWGRTLPGGTAVGDATAIRLDVARWRAAKQRAIRCHRSQWAGLITDDPSGFQMTPAFLALFDTPDELFLETA